MKLGKIEIIVLVSIYTIILIDILLSGIMLDIIALLMGIAVYLFSIKLKQLSNIFFVSAICFLLFSLVLYSINAQYLPYNAAANWAYLFFLFGILRMMFDPNVSKDKK
jgi:hypothetical protein